MQDLFQFILNHWVLVAAFVIVLAIVVAEEMRSKGMGGPRVSTEEAIRLINRENGVVLDIRDRNAYLDGHIIDAISIAAADVEQNLKKLQKYKTKPLIVVCQQGQAAMQVAAKLQKQGFEQVKILAGGMSAWKNANLPTVKGKK